MTEVEEFVLGNSVEFRDIPDGCIVGSHYKGIDVINRSIIDSYGQQYSQYCLTSDFIWRTVGRELVTERDRRIRMVVQTRINQNSAGYNYLKDR